MNKKVQPPHHCAVCDQEVKPEEGMYTSEIEEQALNFCGTHCQSKHERKAAPSKQEREERSNEAA